MKAIYLEYLESTETVLYAFKLVCMALLMSLISCAPNINLEQDKTYMPPATDRVGLAFGVNDNVDILPSGALPISVEKNIGNNGTDAVAAPYQINEDVVRMVFISVAGSAGFVPGNMAGYTAINCNQAGPRLAQGQKQVITYDLGSATCPVNPAYNLINPPPTLQCGLYRETMTADSTNAVKETNENDNRSVNYFFVPSISDRINLAVVRNPNVVNGVFVQGMIVNIVAPTLPAGPPPVVTHAVTASIVPPGSQGFTVNGISPVGPRVSGTICAVAPALPFLVPAGGVLPLTYTCTIPDQFFLGPTCNSFLGGTPAYEEHFDSKITAIANDGCIIAQKFLQVRVFFECQP